jgi:hypothetical protein
LANEREKSTQGTERKSKKSGREGRIKREETGLEVHPETVKVVAFLGEASIKGFAKLLLNQLAELGAGDGVICATHGEAFE